MLGEFHIGAIGIFDAVLVLGLRQNVVGPLEPLQQIFPVLGLQDRIQRSRPTDEQREILQAYLDRFRSGSLAEASSAPAPWLALSVATERMAENPLIELRRQYDEWRRTATDVR